MLDPHLDLSRIDFRQLGVASRSPPSRDNTVPSRGIIIGVPGARPNRTKVCSSSYWVSKYVTSEVDNLPSQTQHKYSAHGLGEENGDLLWAGTGHVLTT